MEETICVYFCPFGQEMKLGRLFVNREKGLQSYSFQFDPEFLTSEYSTLFIDYDLLTCPQRQFLDSEKEFFGFLSDALPDRWGRALIGKRERICAKKENRRPKRFFPEDYLLAVHDESRMGCLRFKTDANGPFLAFDPTAVVPPLESLRDLEYASRMYEKDDNPLNEEWLKLLVSPGSSLGGARPKATVKDESGNLWIAKFPSGHDEYDKGAWEMVAHDLAFLCGIDVPDARLMKLSHSGSTFLAKRFDRNAEARIPYISAMTALGKSDGDLGREDVSYLDIASFLLSNGNQPARDVEQLWKRIVFNIAISNGDDHLRNHGFVLQGRNWALSPAFDLNPSADATHLLLSVDGVANEMDYEVAVASAKHYGVSKEEARECIDVMKKTIRDNLPDIAAKYGLSKHDIAYMSPAFRI